MDFRFDLCEITIKHSIEDRATNCQNILENKEREKPQLHVSVIAERAGFR